MIVSIQTATTSGLEAQRISIELTTSPSLPSIQIVGLPDKAVQESKERIKAAITESGWELPRGKITINLAPADIAKRGSGFDLPIALGIISLIGVIDQSTFEKSLFLGELGLNGELRSIPGVLNVALWCKDQSVEQLVVPADNSREAALVKDISVIPAQSLRSVVEHLQGMNVIEQQPLTQIRIESKSNEQDLLPQDMAYVRGQYIAKRALEIAAAGGHNTLLIGEPGSGKTMLAKAYSTILPPLNREEILEVTRVYSSAGKLSAGEIITQRPFRAPHHSSSHVALVGGGAQIKPGEISLAHRGVLFMDEFPEFDRKTIEVMRQPLEDGYVTISRAQGSVQYPTRVYLLAAANPTPSGYYQHDERAFGSARKMQSYQERFSGPIMDRIDLHVQVDRPKKEHLQSSDLSETSEEILKRVQAARNIQDQRYKHLPFHTNSELQVKYIKEFCVLDAEGQELLDHAIDALDLSGRAYMRILKVSRTIADLHNSEDITTEHLTEALSYRPTHFQQHKVMSRSQNHL